jgi:hypothetical protein
MSHDPNANLSPISLSDEEVAAIAIVPLYGSEPTSTSDQVVANAKDRTKAWLEAVGADRACYVPSESEITALKAVTTDPSQLANMEQAFENVRTKARLFASARENSD